MSSTIDDRGSPALCQDCGWVGGALDLLADGGVCPCCRTRPARIRSPAEIRLWACGVSLRLREIGRGFQLEVDQPPAGCDGGCRLTSDLDLAEVIRLRDWLAVAIAGHPMTTIEESMIQAGRA